MIMPNLFELVGAFARMVGALLRRRALLVNQSVYTHRIGVCHYYVGDCFELKSGQCKDCTCFVHVKALFATEKCPRRHWGTTFLKTRWK